VQSGEESEHEKRREIIGVLILGKNTTLFFLYIKIMVLIKTDVNIDTKSIF